MKLTGMSALDVEINHENIADAVEVIRLLDSPGWKVLDKYFESARELVLEEGKVNATKDSELTSKIRWAILEGYDRYRALPLQIKKQAEIYIQTHSGGTNGE